LLGTGALTGSGEKSVSTPKVDRWTIARAVLLALSGVSRVARADDDGPLQEVVVSATRHDEAIERVPYSISAISGDALQATGVTDLVSLAHQVPSLSLVDLGTRYESSEIPVIRGINASNIVQGPQQLAQSPVGIYIGNSPIEGYFELTDVDRVEVLRGPQGTLYGAGSLGGAVRIIPSTPELGVLSGSITGSVGDVAHASEPSYGYEGFVNLPIGDFLALRLSGKYAYDPGFINVYGIEQRPGGTFSAPAIAEPTEPATSSAIFDEGTKDWNYAKTFTGRSSLLWKHDAFSADLAYTYAHVEGDGGPQTNPYFPGGSYPIDPRISFPAGGNYQYFSGIDQPYRRNTDLTSLDLSYDAGFATVSSTSSYYTTHGETIDDDTYQVFTFTPFEVYYTGNPVNPRFVAVNDIVDEDSTFSQEIRLVSNRADGDRIDYVAGAFFQHENRHSEYDFSAPGTDTYSQAQGCTEPYSGDGTLPDCLVELGPNSAFYDSTTNQTFHDESLFGEVGFHVTRAAQITFGARHYWEDFTASQAETSYPFMTFSAGPPTETSTSKTLFKVNPSFEYAKDQMVYATWSQGFRRGGANSFALTGPVAESPELLSYRPDTTNNYEIGLKGRSDGGFSFALAAFDIEWKNPQIAGFTPVTFTPVVYNADKARSTGFEAEAGSPLIIPGLRYSTSVSYARARLTEDFSLPANNGEGGISPGEITGSAGERLPGSPEWSAALTVTYEHALAANWSMILTANATYSGSILSDLPSPNNPLTETPAYTIGNLSASLNSSTYRISVYIDNVADKRAILNVLDRTDVPIVGSLANFELINRPRELGVRLTYFGSNR
jgi:iron complex outermembrane recepter protein